MPDSNLKEDIFVADRTTGALSLSSVSTSGVRGDGHSFGAAISADGRYVAFASFARNLADGITTPVGKSQIYRRDRTSGSTTLVSAGLAGTGGNGSSGLGFRVAISADGQLVAYDSIATDLITPDANSRSDIFVWDAGSSTTTLISLSTKGVQGDSDSYQPSLSGDGRYVAYESFATNLTTGGTNGQGQIYLRDRTAGTTTKVSVSAGGVEGNALSKNAAVSADGRSIAFDSTSTNLTADPKFFATNSDVYARDRTTGTTVRVSLDSAGLPVNGNSKDAAVSSNGTRISFTSNASFGPPNPSDEIYVRNQTTGEVVQVSVSSAGATGNGFSENSSISGDGLMTAFRSLATNLVTPPRAGVRSSSTFKRPDRPPTPAAISRMRSAWTRMLGSLRIQSILRPGTSSRTATISRCRQGITSPVPTWSPSMQVNDVATSQQDRPDIALGADGATYLIWDDYRTGGQPDIYFSRRDPATGAWSANQKVDDDTTNIPVVGGNDDQIDGAQSQFPVRLPHGFRRNRTAVRTG